MDETTYFAELRALGVNVDDALARMMNMQSLLVKLLAKFPAAAAGDDPAPAFAEGDYETAVRKAHTLKGVTGNLSLTPLYEGYSQVVSLLRAGERAAAEEEFRRLLPVQEQIIACILRHSPQPTK